MTKHRLKPIKSRRAKVAATYKHLFGLFGFISYPKKVNRVHRRKNAAKLACILNRSAPRVVDLYLQQDDDTLIGVSDGKGGVKPFACEWVGTVTPELLESIATNTSINIELDWPRITAPDLHKNLCAYINDNTEL